LWEHTDGWSAVATGNELEPFKSETNKRTRKHKLLFFFFFFFVTDVRGAAGEGGCVSEWMKRTVPNVINQLINQQDGLEVLP